MPRPARVHLIAALALVLGTATCNLFIGLDKFTDTSGAGGSTGSSTSSGAMDCKPGLTQPCYDGPAGTADAGACMQGMQTCSPEGVWGACMGEVKPSPETCASNADEDCDGLECVTWAAGLGNNGTLALGTVNAITPNADKSVIVGGFLSQGTIVLGQTTLTGPGGFVARFEPDGTPTWAVQTTNGGVRVVAVDTDGSIYAAGITAADAMLGTMAVPTGQFTFKLDKNGVPQWVRPMSGFKAGGTFSVYGGPMSIATSPDGGVVVGGVFTSIPVDLGDGALTSASTETAYVVKLDAMTGNGSKAQTGTLWARTFSGYKHGFLFWGPYLGVNKFSLTTVVFNLVGTTNVAGTSLTSSGGVDIGIATIDAMGSTQGAVAFGDSADQTVLGGGVAADGTVLVAGSYLGTIVPDPAHPSNKLTAVSAGGATAGVVYGDGFVMALNASSLLPRLALGFGTAGHATGIAVDPDGGAVISGNFTGKADLGGGMLDAGQGTAVLLAKFKPDGSLFWNRAFSHPIEDGLYMHLAAASDGAEWLGGDSGVFPFDLGTGQLNTAMHPDVIFLGRFAP